ncbi:MAG TPA: hypothetical protein VER39_06800 [Nocardioidaceae bacterium]|nr:hypothetical protein [Nocardioidaceae bacterium]
MSAPQTPGESALATPRTQDVPAPGEWVDALLRSRGAARSQAQSRGGELVRRDPDHFAAVLERMLRLLHDAGRLDDQTIASLTGDELVSDVDDIPSGGVGITSVVWTTPAVVCRIGADLFAFVDECARCHGTWEGVALSRRLGATGVDPVLRCPGCRAHYDVRRGGACLEDESLHLTPLSLSARHSTTAVTVTGPAPSRHRA